MSDRNSGVWGKPTLAVMGSSGLVGSAVLKALMGRQHTWGDVVLMDAADRVGQVVSVHDDTYQIRALSENSFEQIDVAICALPSDLAQVWVPIAVAAGVHVVDCSGAFAEDPSIPLVVADVNFEQTHAAQHGIVCSPTSVTISSALALAPLHDLWALRSVVITALMPASANGADGVQRLLDESAMISGYRDIGTKLGDVRNRVVTGLGPSAENDADPMVHNVIPWVGGPGDGVNSDAELAVRRQLRRVLALPELKVSVTCLHVPVVNGETIVVHARFDRAVSVDGARHALVIAPSVVVLDNPGDREFPMPIDVVGSNPAFAGRLRCPDIGSKTLSFVQCADNTRIGGALNAVMVAEHIVAASTGEPLAVSNP